MEQKKINKTGIIVPTRSGFMNEHDYAEFMETMKIISFADFNSPSWLQHTENPFKWAQSLDPKKLYKGRVEIKLEDYPDEDLGGIYTFEKFCLHLVLIFHNTIMNNKDGMKNSLIKCQDAFDKISCNKTDYMYSRIGSAFEHVLKSVKAHVLFLTEDKSEEESKTIASGVKEFEEMEPEHQAGIHAIKARFYLNCSSPELSLKHMKKSTELDPMCAAWDYWTGKFIRNLRRRHKKLDPEEELYYFEEAVKKRNDPKHILFLAQAYMEKGQYMFKKNNIKMSGNNRINIPRPIQIKINNFNEKAIHLFKKCWRMKRDSSAINKRLGKCLMSLPKRYAAMDLAEEVLLEANKLSNNPITYHILGCFYLKHRQDYEKAKEYFMEGAKRNLRTCFNELIRLKYIIDRDYDPYEDLKSAERCFQYSKSLNVIHADLLWYYLAIKSDIPKAMEYFWKLEEESYFHLTKFRSYTFCVNAPVNMIHIIENELRTCKENEITGPLYQYFRQKIEKIEDLPEDEEDFTLCELKTTAEASLIKARQNMKV